jgi:hypothetical protein
LSQASLVHQFERSSAELLDIEFSQIASSGLTERRARVTTDRRSISAPNIRKALISPNAIALRRTAQGGKANVWRKSP